MNFKKLKVCWLSAGVSSFIAGYIERETIDKYIYIDIEDQHPDSMRFIHDCEKVLGKQVEILKNNEYKNVENAVLAFGGFRDANSGFAPCTGWLKKRVRKQWEDEHKDYELTYVWGFDANEQNRAERMNATMCEFHHCYPLIENNLSKEDAHGISQNLGIKRPIMYDNGYNNNCIGCVKGGMGYWNKIRIDFPEVFKSRANLEKKVGHSILKEQDGTPLFLDKLEPNRGRMSEEVMEDCSIFVI